MTINVHYSRAFLVLFAVAVLAAGLLALVGAKPAWAELRRFDPAPSSPFQVGSTPTTVTNADFNGDGKTDLAAQNNGSNSVSVLLGKGDGSFQQKADFPVGSGPSSVSSTDFNGDGKADLAVANQFSNNVSVLLGNGDGTFSSKTDFAAGSNPTSVTTGRFNADSFVDLAVSNYNSSTVSVLLGQDSNGDGKGDGTFKPKSDFQIYIRTCNGFICLNNTGGPNQVIAADLNGDTRADLATANLGICIVFCDPGGVSVLLGKGDGTFQDPGLAKSGTPITSIDVSGSADIVATEYDNNVVSVLLGSGAGTFSPGQRFPVGSSPSAVTSTDLDGNSVADLAVSNFNSDNVSVLWGNGRGSFQPAQNFPAGDGPAFVIGANANADSFADLAVANQNSNNVSVLLNTTVDTTPPPPPEITSPPNNTIDTDGNFTVSGTAEANSTVELFEGLASRGTATANASGQWSRSLAAVADGSHTYTARAKDAAGNTSDPSIPLKVEVRIPPLVSNVAPPDEAQNVAVSTNATATFSEAMDEESVEASGTFTLEQGTSPVAATVTYNSVSKEATLDPNPDLTWNTTYTATINGGPGGAKDAAGNALEQDYIWNFTTANDTTAPSTTHTLSPQPNAAGWNNANFTVTLNATDTGGSGVKEIVYSASGAQAIPSTTVPGGSATFNINTEGTTTISYLATDNVGNREAPPKTFDVKLDKSAPTLDTDNSDGSDGITPDNKQTGVSRDLEPTATFSEEMAPASLSTAVKLYQWNARKHKWKAVPVAVSVVGEKATLNPYPADPARLLAANKKFKVTVTTGAKNLAGLPLSSTRSWTFTTGSR